MAKISIKKFATQGEAQVYLNGGLIVRKPTPGEIGSLNGRTLVFSAPSVVTVTFTGVSCLKDVLAQIRAAIPAVLVLDLGDSFGLVQATPSGGVALTGGTSTAAAFFGISGNPAGTVFPPATVPPVAPSLLHVVGDGSGGLQLVVYEV